MLVKRPVILAQRARSTAAGLVRALSLRRLLMLLVLALCGVAAFGLTPGTMLDDGVATVAVTRALPLPVLAPRDDAGSTYWREERVQPGDTIGSLLARAGVEDAAALNWLRNDA